MFDALESLKESGNSTTVTIDSKQDVPVSPLRSQVMMYHLYVLLVKLKSTMDIFTTKFNFYLYNLGVKLDLAYFEREKIRFLSTPYLIMNL